MNYNWKNIATLLDISRSTLYRRLADAGVSPDDYSPLLPTEIDEVLLSIKKEHPNEGETKRASCSNSQSGS